MRLVGLEIPSRLIELLASTAFRAEEGMAELVGNTSVMLARKEPSCRQIVADTIAKPLVANIAAMLTEFIPSETDKFLSGMTSDICPESFYLSYFIIR